jgi:CHAD domain-containing protein
VIGISPDSEEPAKGATAAELVAAMLDRQLHAIRAHDPGTRLGADPEELHDMRVATRRARAILRTARPLFDPGWTDNLRAELKWLGGVQGAVRDLDVFLVRLEKGIAGLESRERRAGKRLVAAVQEEREEARRALLEALGSERYRNLLGEIAAGIANPPALRVDIEIRDLAGRQFAKLREEMRKLGPDASNEDVHRARIKAKRARYAAELAAAADGKKAARFLERAKRFQDVAGEHQDAVVAERRLRALASQAKAPTSAYVAGRLAEQERKRRYAARTDLPKAWRKLERAGRKAWA